MNCAGVHRAIGVHVSKIRSTTLDRWDAKQLAGMVAGGNVASNQIFEANLPSNLLRLNEFSDSKCVCSLLFILLYMCRICESRFINTMRRARDEFIRAKYEQRKWYRAPIIAAVAVAQVVASESSSQSTLNERQQQAAALFQGISMFRFMFKCVYYLYRHDMYLSSVTTAGMGIPAPVASSPIHSRIIDTPVSAVVAHPVRVARQHKASPWVKRTGDNETTTAENIASAVSPISNDSFFGVEGTTCF